MTSKSFHNPELKRALGPIASAAILTGTVIGTGIFLVPSTMARETGSVEGVFLIWLTGALLSLSGALSYAELGASYPAAGGEYVYLRKAYGPLFGFLFGWQQIVIGKTGSIAGMAIAFSMFIGFFVENMSRLVIDETAGPFIIQATGTQIAAIFTVVLLTLINSRGVGAGTLVQELFTALKIGAILLLVVLVLGSGRGSWTHFSSPSTFEPAGNLARLLGAGAALSAALWAFDGWNNLTLVGSEIRDPHRTIPRVLIMGVMGVAVIYMLANLSYFYALPFDSIKQSHHVGQDVAESILGSFGATALTIAALISTFAALNGSILSGSRIYYAMARDGLFFSRMSKLNSGSQTPVAALVLQCLLATSLIMLFARDKAAFERILDYAMFGTWAFYAVTVLAVIVLRVREPGLTRPYMTLGYPWIPIMFAFVATLFCISIAMRRPEETLFGLLLLAAGIPFYLFWKWRNGINELADF